MIQIDCYYANLAPSSKRALIIESSRADNKLTREMLWSSGCTMRIFALSCDDDVCELRYDMILYLLNPNVPKLKLKGTINLMRK